MCARDFHFPASYIADRILGMGGHRGPMVEKSGTGTYIDARRAARVGRAPNAQGDSVFPISTDLREQLMSDSNWGGNISGSALCMLAPGVATR